MMRFSRWKIIPCDRFPRQWPCIEAVLWRKLTAKFASADTCYFHRAQTAASTKLAVVVPGVANSQVKHIQGFHTCMGQKKDNACQFLLLVCEVTFISPLSAAALQIATKMSTACINNHVQPHPKMHKRCILQPKRWHILPHSTVLNLVTLQTVSQWAVIYVQRIC